MKKTEDNRNKKKITEYKPPKETAMPVRILVIIIGSVVFALNINSFVHTGGLLPGGAAGVTLLIQEICLKFFNFHIPYTLVNLLINSVPVYIGFKYIGKKFTMLSCLVIGLSSVLTDMLPSYVVTKDILLICIFGGLINGVVISMFLMVDATSGGTDFISIYLSQKRGIDSFNIILAFNAVILCIAGMLFSWDKALYSIIFQYVSTTTIRLMYRKYQQTTLFIVTSRPDEICAVIYELTHHGATIMEGAGSYEHHERKIIYSIVASNEVNKVMSAIHEVEPGAFVNALKTERVSGKFYMVPKD